MKCLREATRPSPCLARSAPNSKVNICRKRLDSKGEWRPPSELFFRCPDNGAPGSSIRISDMNGRQPQSVSRLGEVELRVFGRIRPRIARLAAPDDRARERVSAGLVTTALTNAQGPGDPSRNWRSLPTRQCRGWTASSWSMVHDAPPSIASADAGGSGRRRSRRAVLRGWRRTPTGVRRPSFCRPARERHGAPERAFGAPFRSPAGSTAARANRQGVGAIRTGLTARVRSPAVVGGRHVAQPRNGRSIAHR